MQKRRFCCVSIWPYAASPACIDIHCHTLAKESCSEQSDLFLFLSGDRSPSGSPYLHLRACFPTINRRNAIRILNFGSEKRDRRGRGRRGSSSASAVSLRPGSPSSRPLPTSTEALSSSETIEWTDEFSGFQQNQFGYLSRWFLPTNHACIPRPLDFLSISSSGHAVWTCTEHATHGTASLHFLSPGPRAP